MKLVIAQLGDEVFAALLSAYGIGRRTTIMPVAGVLTVPDGFLDVVVPSYADINNVVLASMLANGTSVPDSARVRLFLRGGGSVFNTTGTGLAYAGGTAIVGLVGDQGQWVIGEHS